MIKINHIGFNTIRLQGLAEAIVGNNQVTTNSNFNIFVMVVQKLAIRSCLSTSDCRAQKYGQVSNTIICISIIQMIKVLTNNAFICNNNTMIFHRKYE